MNTFENSSFPKYSSREQTIRINELLGANESYYTVYDVVRLPQDIEYRGTRGYVSFSHLGIDYTSVDNNWVIKICYSTTGVGKNIYDFFIDVLKFLTEKIPTGEVKVNDTNIDCCILKDIIEDAKANIV